MPIECYGATRQQDGRSTNEDAFLLGRGEVPFAVLCDGAGNAQQAARKVLRLFENLFKEASPKEIVTDRNWAKWVKLLDSSLLGGVQSTFVGVGFVRKMFVGACAGDSRAYHMTRDGDLRILTESASKFRLGSGSAKAFPFRGVLNSGDVLLLLSDGAWTPLSLYHLKKALLSMVGRHFSEVPQAILEAAGRTGRADDMTAVAIRFVR